MNNILSDQQNALLRHTRDTLNALREALAAAGATEADRSALAESIRQLDQLFLLVIAGEFNSGKSTFVNALLGVELQEVGVTPTTSKIHLLKYAAEPTRAMTGDGVLIQTAPVELLKEINIVDTPGTNAIVREHEALTEEFIPRSDLVLFVSSADRPFTESERAFLERIRSWGKKIVLVVNKIDLLDTEDERAQVLTFVETSARSLVGAIPAVFGVSSRQALRAKKGGTSLWEPSGFPALEDFIYSTLDDAGRFRLKLNNPLGVARKLLAAQLARNAADLDALEADQQLLADVDAQMDLYEQDMQRNFEARLGEINNLLYEMQQRGDEFFDENLRLARVPDLVRREKIQRDFERQVVGETPRHIEDRVSELIDWMVEQDLRQWTAVSDRLERRRTLHHERIVGGGGPREGTLAYDRQRLIDSIGLATRQAVATYDKEKQSAELADSAREAVISTGIAGAATVAGLSLALAGGLASTFWDVTGITAGVTGLAFGIFILPNRRRTAKADLHEKIEALRAKLVDGLQRQFEREMRRSIQRVGDTIAPYSRFVRAQVTKIEQERAQFQEFGEALTSIGHTLDELAAERSVP